MQLALALCAAASQRQEVISATSALPQKYNRCLANPSAAEFASGMFSRSRRQLLCLLVLIQVHNYVLLSNKIVDSAQLRDVLFALFFVFYLFSSLHSLLVGTYFIVHTYPTYFGYAF